MDPDGRTATEWFSDVWTGIGVGSTFGIFGGEEHSYKSAYFIGIGLGVGSMFIGEGEVVVTTKISSRVVAPAKRLSNTRTLGHYPEYVKSSDKLNTRRFEIPENIWNKMSQTEQWGDNMKFLDRMISKGDDIILATPAQQARNGSYYMRALEYLKERGYQLNQQGTKMQLHNN